MHVNLLRPPPEGHHYPVAEGVVLRAPTYDALYLQIAEYRSRNGIPLGSPQKDVDDYVCGKWPHFCQPDKSEGPTKEDLHKKLFNRVAEWAARILTEMPAGGYTLVELKEAARRAEVCQKCPYNQSWKVTCAPCNANTDSVLSTVRRLKRTGIDTSLKGCAVCGHDNLTGIWLPDDVMRATEEERAKVPSFCYKLKL